jgi:hypothetical protein
MAPPLKNGRHCGEIANSWVELQGFTVTLDLTDDEIHPAIPRIKFRRTSDHAIRLCIVR